MRCLVTGYAGFDATCRAADAPAPPGEVVNVAGGSRVGLREAIGGFPDVEAPSDADA